MTSAGVYVEDIPQFIIQLSYSVIMSVKFKQVVSPFQWISFALTFWHFGFSGSWKYITFGEPPPPRWEEYFIEKTDDLEQGVELMVDGAEVAKSVNLLAIARV